MRGAGGAGGTCGIQLIQENEVLCKKKKKIDSCRIHGSVGKSVL